MFALAHNCSNECLMRPLHLAYADAVAAPMFDAFCWRSYFVNSIVGRAIAAYLLVNELAICC